MATLYTERAGKSQIGYSTNSSSAYAVGGGDLSFSTGLHMYCRMKIWIPRGATINTATLSMQVIAKNAGTAQTAYLSYKALASGDAPVLRTDSAYGLSARTAAGGSWTLVWPVNPTGDVIAQLDVKNIVNEIVSRSDYQPGGYITFVMVCDNENGSDLSVRANNDFAPTWGLSVDYTENNIDLKTDVNLHNNPNNESLPWIDSSPLPFWGQNAYFGAMVDVANQGTIARDTSFVRPGVGAPTLRFTTGTPPASGTAGTGPFTTSLLERDKPYIFAGWIYVPAAVTGVVRAGDPYLGHLDATITARDQWVPFCSTPTDVSTGRGVFWPCVRIIGPWQAGWQFWISEPTIMQSGFKQMPFSGFTPDVKDPGGSTLIDYKWYGSGQGAAREYTPRSAVIRSGQLRRVPRYEMRSDGILQLTQAVKGGPLVTGLPATAISSYPAGKTISEL